VNATAAQHLRFLDAKVMGGATPGPAKVAIYPPHDCPGQTRRIAFIARSTEAGWSVGVRNLQIAVAANGARAITNHEIGTADTIEDAAALCWDYLAPMIEAGSFPTPDQVSALTRAAAPTHHGEHHEPPDRRDPQVQ
jgi:hypothetical protein